MSLEASLVAFLLADEDIKTALGDRAYHIIVPEKQNSFPALAVQRITTTTIQGIGGASGIKAARDQIKVWARTQAAARSLGDLISERLTGFRGTWGDDTIHNVTAMDEGEDELDGTDVNPLFNIRQDYEIWFS